MASKCACSKTLHPGGKARSVVFPARAATATLAPSISGATDGSERTYRANTGFGFFPRFYKHIIDTMSRIPYRNTRTVADNLVDTTGTVFARFDKRPLKLPNITPQSAPRMDLPELFAAANDLRTLFGRTSASRPKNSRSSAKRSGKS